jgi:hypothetical protein
MERTHVLAVVSRAKAIARSSDISVRDEVLGYLCTCAEIDGTWASFLHRGEGAPGTNEGRAGIAIISVPLLLWRT